MVCNPHFTNPRRFISILQMVKVDVKDSQLTPGSSMIFSESVSISASQKALIERAMPLHVFPICELGLGVVERRPAPELAGNCIVY